jgi:hypothetical protein
VRRILKARVPLEDLEKLRQSLVDEVTRRGKSASSSEPPADASDQESAE